MIPFANMAPTLIQHLGATGLVTLHRFAAGTNDQTTGYFVPGAETQTSVDCVVNITDPRTSDLIPEGERNAIEAIEIFSAQELRPAEGSAQADQITWNGVRWRVVGVDQWGHNAGYYRSVAVRHEAP